MNGISLLAGNRMQCTILGALFMIRSNWNLEFFLNLEMLVFEVRGKLEYPKKNLLEQRREPTANSSHVRRWVWE